MKTYRFLGVVALAMAVSMSAGAAVINLDGSIAADWGATLPGGAPSLTGSAFAASPGIVQPGAANLQDFDVESIYLYVDAEPLDQFNNFTTGTLFFAMVTGFDFNTGEPGGPAGNPIIQAGDIFFNIGNVALNGYNAAVHLEGVAPGSLQNANAIRSANLGAALPTSNVIFPQFYNANPYQTTAAPTGTAQVFWTDIEPANEHSRSATTGTEFNVLEGSLALDQADLDAILAGGLSVHWTMQCGNDYINDTARIRPIPHDVVPEPGTMVLLGLGLGGLVMRSFGRRSF